MCAKNSFSRHLQITFSLEIGRI